MKSFSLLVGLLLAGSALAAPTKDVKKPLDKERAIARLRKFRENAALRANSTTNPAPAGVDTSNWGGAQQTSTSVTAVAASITIPTVSFPTGAGTPDPSEEYYGCAWIGIDGWDSCQNLWQAGGYWEASGGGDFSYYAFYEWYPADPIFTKLTVNPGDVLDVQVVATSTTSGTFSITDSATGASASDTLTGQPALCEQTAEWIVEDNVPSETPYADFGSVQFTGASYTADGTTAGVSGATILTLNNNGITWTNCGTSGDSTVNCSYMS